MAVEYWHEKDLLVNKKKTKQLLLGEITSRIPQTDDTGVIKYLGVTINVKLSMIPHINSICIKLSTGLYVLCKQ